MPRPRTNKVQEVTDEKVRSVLASRHLTASRHNMRKVRHELLETKTSGNETMEGDQTGNNEKASSSAGDRTQEAVDTTTLEEPAKGVSQTEYALRANTKDLPPEIRPAAQASSSFEPILHTPSTTQPTTPTKMSAESSQTIPFHDTLPDSPRSAAMADMPEHHTRPVSKATEVSTSGQDGGTATDKVLQDTGELLRMFQELSARVDNQHAELEIVKKRLATKDVEVASLNKQLALKDSEVKSLNMELTEVKGKTIVDLQKTLAEVKESTWIMERTASEARLHFLFEEMGPLIRPARYYAFNNSRKHHAYLPDDLALAINMHNSEKYLGELDKPSVKQRVIEKFQRWYGLDVMIFASFYNELQRARDALPILLFVFCARAGFGRLEQLSPGVAPQCLYGHPSIQPNCNSCLRIPFRELLRCIISDFYGLICHLVVKHGFKKVEDFLQSKSQVPQLELGVKQRAKLTKGFLVFKLATWFLLSAMHSPNLDGLVTEQAKRQLVKYFGLGKWLALTSHTSYNSAPMPFEAFIAGSSHTPDPTTAADSTTRTLYKSMLEKAREAEAPLVDWYNAVAASESASNNTFPANIPAPELGVDITVRTADSFVDVCKEFCIAQGRGGQ